MKIAIVDYNMGNLFSVHHACVAVGLNPEITSDKKVIRNSDGLILPGVGAFRTAMEHLIELDLIETIYSFIKSGKPFLGICLGMQLLFTESEEFGSTSGLNIIEGKVIKFPTKVGNEEIKVPQIGWNKIYRFNDNRFKNRVLDGISNGEYMYFVHSFYSKPFNNKDILTTTEYESINYCSAVQKDNIIATQFHPEKSSKKGISFYKNWAQIVHGRF